MTYKSTREGISSQTQDSDVTSRHMVASTNSAAALPARVAEHVTSRDNRWLKQFRAALAGESPRASRTLTNKRATHPSSESLSAPVREPQSEIIAVEGARFVHAALQTAMQSGLEIIAILTSESGARHLPPLAAIIPPAARIISTTDRLFAHISGTETPQGIAALLRPYAATFDDLVRGTPLIVVLLGVQDPGNVGALVRTAEVFGATGIAACPLAGTGTANPFRPKALRASAGSALRLPILRGVAAPVLLTQLRIAGVAVYATSPAIVAREINDDVDASIGTADSGDSALHVAEGGSAHREFAPWDVDWRAPAAILMGNEGAGLPAYIVRSANATVRIPHALCNGPDPSSRANPMNPINRSADAPPDSFVASPVTLPLDSAADSPVDSLNVAVAGAILLYEAARQRGLG